MTLPIAVIAFGTAKPHWLATEMSPAGELISEKPCEKFVLAAIPVWAFNEP